MDNLSNTLGNPIPDSEHAVSVSLPEWEDVIGYEEKEERVIQKLQLGYPRFVIHPIVQELFDFCSEQYTNAEESCFIFPTSKVAERAKSFIESKSSNSKTRVFRVKQLDLYGIITENKHKDLLKAYWQHSGEIISSRKAKRSLQEIRSSIQPTEGNISDAKTKIISKIASLTNTDAEDIYLFPSGMAAIFFAHRLLKIIKPSLRTVQFGFPYTDTLKIQEKFGDKEPKNNVELFPKGNDDFDQLEQLLQQEHISGLFTEFPTNPLLQSVDLDKLINLSSEHDFPVVVDDTIVTFANANLIEKVDVVVTSLTKFFSGIGNSMAGSMILSKKSRFYRDLKPLIDIEYEDLLYEEDAETLWDNCQDFENRMDKINQNTEQLCDFLKKHDYIRQIYYPKFIDKDNYKKNTKDNAGYSGLFSVEFKNPEDAPKFYNYLNVAKGPSLGTSYTLACPYTLLAHYGELDYVEKCGVSRNLVRISVGTEDIKELIKTFDNALSEMV